MKCLQTRTRRNDDYTIVSPEYIRTGGYNYGNNAYIYDREKAFYM